MTARGTATVDRPHAAPVPRAQVSLRTRETQSPSNAFVTMALTMSWQLALSVIVPVLAGQWIDVRFNVTPWGLLMGLLLAVAASCIVLWRAVAAANEYAARSTGDKR